MSGINRKETLHQVVWWYHMHDTW